MSTTETPIFARIPPAAIFDPAIGPAALRVLAALCSYVDKDGFCWPSVSTVAQRLGLQVRVVQVHIRALQAAGYVEIEMQPKGIGKGANRYQIIYETGQRVQSECTPTGATRVHPPVQSSNTPRVQPECTLTIPLNQTHLTKPSGTIPSADQGALSEVSRTSRVTDPATHLVKRCSRYGGSTEQAWEFAMSLSTAELPVMAYDNSNTPMRAYLAFLAKQPSSGQAALHPRGSWGKQQREALENV